MHRLIVIDNISLSFPHKICFKNFFTKISFGEHIAIIGNNGSGKSSLISMIIRDNPDINFGYVPQIVDNFETISGGELFNKSLSRALASDPQILLLDEPTNHLDYRNRKSLIRLLQSYSRTSLIVTHDVELLEKSVNIIWHISGGEINIFNGKYSDYMHELHLKSQVISDRLKQLKQEEKNAHISLMKTQEKISKSKLSGKKKVTNKKWIKSVADLKSMKAEKFQGTRLQSINKKKEDLLKQVSCIRLPEKIKHKFTIIPGNSAYKTIVSIAGGNIKYNGLEILKNINLSLVVGEKLSIIGDNGSGKTMLARAIYGDENIAKSGIWECPTQRDIGYLDQYYSNLDRDKSVFDIIASICPNWTHHEVRKHLNNFLFRRNEEINTLVNNLSGGEKARLSLAQIAASPPKLLILDEITNNIDLETKEHITEILKSYLGTVIVISHNSGFLENINVDKYYETNKNNR